jgi:hypothetical protein
MIGASLWIFEYIPFKIKRPKKQLFYAYLWKLNKIFSF